MCRSVWKSALFAHAPSRRDQVHSIRSERDSLATTVSRLESALSAAQLSSDSLGSDAARLAQQLEASEAVRSTQVARIGELEALEREVQTLRSVERELEDLKDKFDSKKEAFAREKSDELRLGLQDIHARALMELQVKTLLLEFSRQTLVYTDTGKTHDRTRTKSSTTRSKLRRSNSTKFETSLPRSRASRFSTRIRPQPDHPKVPLRARRKSQRQTTWRSKVNRELGRAPTPK